MRLLCHCHSRANHIYPITDTRTNKEHNIFQHQGFLDMFSNKKTKTKMKKTRTRFSRFVSLYFLIDRCSLIYSVLFVSFWTLVVVSAMKSLLRSYNAPHYNSLF